eukprot:gb/GECG01001352.1/.p1 GENE.gb/GECG01001352.1/~~gb/GECG01001352.1/.p1  ORF type:complete len:362 (+),score=23.00 gb/GECG01001352.1/:1-1086(+)
MASFKMFSLRKQHGKSENNYKTNRSRFLLACKIVFFLALVASASMLWWTAFHLRSAGILNANGQFQQTFTDSTKGNHSKYLIMSAAVGYHYYDYEKFITTLRRHYSGDVVLFVGDNDAWASSLVEKCFGSTVRVVRMNSVVSFGAKGDRYIAYSNYCQNYTFCFATDFRDVFFQDDPFRGVPRGYHLVLMEEETTGIGYALSNKRWIRSCWGDKFLYDVFDIPPVCSGTIYGTPHGFRVLKDLMLDEMNRSAVKKCLARDQGHLNYLVLSKSFPFPILRQARGHSAVNTMARMPLAQVRSWYAAGKVYNDDGTVSPVVHHYDRFSELSGLASSLVAKRQPGDVVTCSHSQMMWYCYAGLRC